MKTITVSEANRGFSRLLREVAQGESFTIVSRGRVVAAIKTAEAEIAQRSLAKSDLLSRLNKQSVTGDRNWTRDELYG